MVHCDLPIVARFWPEWIQDRVVERIAIMREGNRIPDQDRTPREIMQVALDLAQTLMSP